MEAGAGLEQGVRLSLDENRVAGNDGIAQRPPVTTLTPSLRNSVSSVAQMPC